MNSSDWWILANINVTGFYRVNYDLGNWDRLISQLNSDHKVANHSESTRLRFNQKRTVSNLSPCLLFHLAV